MSGSSEVKKNITVVARVRPAIGQAALSSAKRTPGCVTVSVPGQPRTFESDVAYGAGAPNSQLYGEQIEPLVQRVLMGYNACVLLYGASRSGKSYTLMGDSNAEGIIGAAVDSLFSTLQRQANSSKALVTLAVFDAYSTHVLDLLNPQTKTGLQLLDHRAQGCVVDGVAELVCVSGAEVHSLLKQAMAAHDVLEARITNQLGKPHTFVDVRVEVIDNDNPSTIRYATLRFCSAAGSGGVSLKFNQGLQALNKVADTLAAGNTDSWNIPYASSRLTRLLEPSLGGNALTVWITTLDPSERAGPDSVHGMELAEKVRRIKCAARVNKNTIASTIRGLREEINKARGKLQLTQPGTLMHDIDPAQLRVLKSMITELERVKSHTWEAKRSRSQAMHETRRVSLEQEGLLYTLVEAKDVDLPEQLVLSGRTMLRAIVSSRASLDEQENELEEKRSLFKLRLESVQRKAIGAAGGMAAASGAGVPTLQELTRGDEKLTKLSVTIAELEGKCRSAQGELQGMEEDYRRLLTKIATLESKQRKLFLIGRDAAGLERLNKSAEWSTMRREADADPALLQSIQTLNQNADTQKQAINGLVDARAIKDAAVAGVEGMREAQEMRARCEWERDALWCRLIESKFKSEVSMTRYQEHMFFMFRNYRSHFEEQKERMEARYRELLESSVKDALKLSEENQKLRAQLEARLKQI